MPVHPFTHDHRSSVIDTNDFNHLRDLDDVPLSPAKPDVDQPVSVGDILDAWESYLARDDSTSYADYLDVFHAAPESVSTSYRNVWCVLDAYRDLSPEEQAEFDRRTT